MIRAQKGFTLLELMIAVAIGGILVAVAVPSYRNYVMRANRSVARDFMVNAASKEENYAMQNTPSHGYAGDFFTLLGVGSSTAQTTVYLDNAGNVSSSSTSAIYKVAFNTGDPQSAAPYYTLKATALNKQLNDTSCVTITLDQLGKKTPAPAGGTNDCWNR